MSYGPSNPRPIRSWTTAGKRVREYSLNALQKETTLNLPEVRKPVADDKLPPIDTITEILVTTLMYDAPAKEYSIRHVELSTASIFENPYVLPYSLPPRYAPEGNLRDKLEQYARILDQYPIKFRPRLYAVTRSFYIDEFGRQYKLNNYGYLVYCFHFDNGTRVPTAFGDGRSERAVTQGATTLKLALYTWSGLAGLTTESQARIMSSRGFDVHHGDENLFDMRPQSLFPIPTFLHRYVHGEYHSISSLRLFFKHD